MSNRRRFLELHDSGEAVLEIPSFSVLRRKSPTVLLEDFEQLWGVKPKLIAIPAVEYDGPLFEVEGLRGIDFSQYAQVSPQYPGFEDVVREFSSRGYGIVLLMYPNLSFIPGEGLGLRDILGAASSPFCVANPRSRNILAAILGTGIDIAREVCAKQPGKLYGIALDATDLWPMGGKLGRVEANCFCAACTQHFETIAPDLLKQFKNFPNPWSLLLKPSSTGISYVDEIGPLTSADEVVGLSKQRGFAEQFQNAPDPVLLSNANILLRYMRGRHDQTIGSLGGIFDEALQGLDDKPRRILVMEGERYNWTSGLWLEELDARYDPEGSPYDELWLNITPAYIPEKVPYRALMWRRSHYLISSFYDLTAAVTTPNRRAILGYAKMTPDQLREQARQLMLRTLGSGLNNEGALLALPKMAERQGGESASGSAGRLGFVGVSFDKDYSTWFVNQLNTGQGSGELGLPQPLPGAGNLDPQLLELLLKLGLANQQDE